MKAIREALASGHRLPLDQIEDPVRRLRAAEARMERNELGDEKAFIHGLLMNVVDPIGQAKKVEQPPKSGVSTDMFGMDAADGQSHSLWYNSLSRLRDLGKDEARRQAVIAAIAPLAKNGPAKVRLASALALADLGSDAGREALIGASRRTPGPCPVNPRTP